jgi:hypothetical protein
MNLGFRSKVRGIPCREINYNIHELRRKIKRNKMKVNIK